MAFFAAAPERFQLIALITVIENKYTTPLMRTSEKRTNILVSYAVAQSDENRMSAAGDEINTGDGCDQRENEYLA